MLSARTHASMHTHMHTHMHMLHNALCNYAVTHIRLHLHMPCICINPIPSSWQTADIQMDVSDCWPSSVQCIQPSNTLTRLLNSMPFTNTQWTIQAHSTGCPAMPTQLLSCPHMPTHQGPYYTLGLPHHTHLNIHLLTILCTHSVSHANATLHSHVAYSHINTCTHRKHALMTAGAHAHAHKYMHSTRACIALCTMQWFCNISLFLHMQ